MSSETRYFCDKCKTLITEQEYKFVVEVSEIYTDRPYCPRRIDLCRECYLKLDLPQEKKEMKYEIVYEKYN